MANQNIHQVFVANPITTNASTDLMYFGQSPYGIGNDAAMTFANFAAQFTSPWSAGAGAGSAKGGNATAAAGTSSLAWGLSVTATNAGSFVIGDHFGHSATDSTTNQFVSTFKNGHFWYTSPAGTALLCSSINSLGQFVTAQGVCDTSYSYQTPTTGFSITASRSSETLDLNPAGTLATGTIIFPSNPNDGQIFRTTTTNDITALTLNGNSHTISNAVTTLAAGQGFMYKYNLAQTTWFPVYQSQIITPGVTASQVQKNVFNYFPDTGTTNSIAVTMSPVPSITGGLSVLFIAGNNNSGPCTININGTGGIPLEGNDGNSLVTGNILAGVTYEAIVDVSAGFAQLMNPTAVGGASPWSAGAGTGSAVGGDGTCTAAGNYSASFGQNNTAGGTGDFCVGTGNTLSGVGSFASGQGNSSNGNWNATFNLGNTNGGSFSFVCGHANQLDVGNGCFIGGGSYRNTGYDYNFSWGDNVGTTNYPTANGQWNINCSGGFKLWQGNGNLIFSADANGNVINGKGVADQSKTIVAPTTGGTVTLVTTNRRTILNPAGTLATLTVDMPASPIDGQLQTVSTTQIITALTVTGGGHSIIGTQTALAVGQSFTMVYNLGDTTWYPG